MAALPGLVAVRGNTDRYTLTQPPSAEAVPSSDRTLETSDRPSADWLIGKLTTPWG